MNAPAVVTDTVAVEQVTKSYGTGLSIAGVAPNQREAGLRLLLDIVGLGDHARQRPGELIGIAGSLFELEDARIAAG